MTRVLKPLFTRSNRAANLTIVLLLSFGLGAAALLSAALDRFLLHPLDVPHPETLVRAVERHPPVINSEWLSSSLYDAMRSMRTMRDVAVEGDIDTAVSLRSSANEDVRPIAAQMVSGNYFSMLGAAAAFGRTLGPADEHASAIGVPVVLSDRFWTRAFAHSTTILGSTLTIQGKPFVIVGIMPHSFVGTRIDDSPDVWLPLSAQPLLPIFYTPMQLRTYEGTQYLYVRTQGPPEAIIAAVRNTLAQLDPRLPFSEIVTMQQQVSESLWQERLLAVLAAIFSIVSILMAATGLYGLLAYDASQRTREFGIRIAVGAQRTSVASLLLRDLVRIVLPGAAAGVLLCILLSRLVASTLYGVRPSDPVSFTAALLAVSAIAVAASCLPVWRTLRIDPATILRDE